MKRGMERLLFRRGHGSTWGSQFLVEMNRELILRLEGFSPDHPGGKLLRYENIPMEPELWQRVCAAVEALKPMLRKKRRKLIKPRPTVDGGKWWALSIVWKDREIQYQWPQCPEAAALEGILEQLAEALIRQNVHLGEDPEQD